MPDPRPTAERVDTEQPDIAVRLRTEYEGDRDFDRRLRAEAADTLDAVRAERDEARDWVRRLHRETQTVTCVYCGQAYPPGTPTSGSEALTAHVRQCPKHPMAQALADAAALAAECNWHRTIRRDPETVYSAKSWMEERLDAAITATDALGSLSRYPEKT